MSYVITGTTGPFGRLVVTELLSRGVPAGDILATGRDAGRLTDLADQGVRTAVLDYDDPDDGVLSSGDVLLLVSGPELGRRVEQHRKVLDAAARAGVDRVVYTSAPSPDTSPLPVAPDHAATEAIIGESGLPFTLLRNGWYAENYLPVVDQAKETGMILGSARDGRISSASRADLAAAAAIVLRQEGHADAVYELGGDEAWTMADLAEMVSDASGRSVAYRDVSSSEHRRQLAGAGLDEATAGFLVEMDKHTAAGALHITTGDLTRLLGRPVTPMAQIVRSWA